MTKSQSDESQSAAISAFSESWMAVFAWRRKLPNGQRQSLAPRKGLHGDPESHMPCGDTAICKLLSLNCSPFPPPRALKHSVYRCNVLNASTNTRPSASSLQMHRFWPARHPKLLQQTGPARHNQIDDFRIFFINFSLLRPSDISFRNLVTALACISLSRVNHGPTLAR